MRIKSGLFNVGILPYSSPVISPHPPLASSLQASQAQFAVSSHPAAFVYSALPGKIFPLFIWLNAIISSRFSSGHTSSRKSSWLTFTTTHHHLETVCGVILSGSFMTLCVKTVHLNGQCLASNEL